MFLDRYIGNSELSLGEDDIKINNNIYIMVLLEIYYKNIEVDRRGISMILFLRKEMFRYRNN